MNTTHLDQFTRAIHTPGPWDIMEGKTLLHIETANTGDGKPCGVPICSVPKKCVGNAALIAAAPDLLTLVQRIAHTDGFVQMAVDARALLAQLSGIAPACVSTAYEHHA